jgi:hypothetical protein
MAKINKISEQLELPTKDGWYWIKYYEDRWFPAWLSQDINKGVDEPYFLVGGLGDESSGGIYVDEIIEIGPEIQEPTF